MATLNNLNAETPEAFPDPFAAPSSAGSPTMAQAADSEPAANLSVGLSDEQVEQIQQYDFSGAYPLEYLEPYEESPGEAEMIKAEGDLNDMRAGRLEIPSGAEYNAVRREYAHIHRLPTKEVNGELIIDNSEEGRRAMEAEIAARKNPDPMGMDNSDDNKPPSTSSLREPSDVERAFASMPATHVGGDNLMMVGPPAIKKALYAELERTGKLSYINGSPMTTISPKEANQLYESIAASLGYEVSRVARMDMGRKDSFLGRVFGKNQVIEIVVAGNKVTDPSHPDYKNSLHKRVDDVANFLNRLDAAAIPAADRLALKEAEKADAESKKAEKSGETGKAAENSGKKSKVAAVKEAILSRDPDDVASGKKGTFGHYVAHEGKLYHLKEPLNTDKNNYFHAGKDEYFKERQETTTSSEKAPLEITPKSSFGVIIGVASDNLEGLRALRDAEKDSEALTKAAKAAKDKTKEGASADGSSKEIKVNKEVEKTAGMLSAIMADPSKLKEVGNTGPGGSKQDFATAVTYKLKSLSDLELSTLQGAQRKEFIMTTQAIFDLSRQGGIGSNLAKVFDSKKEGEEHSLAGRIERLGLEYLKDSQEGQGYLKDLAARVEYLRAGLQGTQEAKASDAVKAESNPASDLAAKPTEAAAEPSKEPAQKEGPDTGTPREDKDAPRESADATQEAAQNRSESAVLREPQNDTAIGSKLNALLSAQTPAQRRETATALLSSLDSIRGKGLERLDSRTEDLHTSKTLGQLATVVSAAEKGAFGQENAALAGSLKPALNAWADADMRRISDWRESFGDAAEGNGRVDHDLGAKEGKESVPDWLKKASGMDAQKSQDDPAPRSDVSATPAAEVEASSRALDARAQTETAAMKVAAIMANPAKNLGVEEGSKGLSTNWSDKGLNELAANIVKLDAREVDASMSQQAKNELAAYSSWLEKNVQSGKLESIPVNSPLAEQIKAKTQELQKMSNGKLDRATTRTIERADRMSAELDRRSNAMTSGAQSSDRSIGQTSSSSSRKIGNQKTAALDVSYAVHRNKSALGKNKMLAKSTLEMAGQLNASELSKLSVKEKAEVVTALEYLSSQVKGGSMLGTPDSKSPEVTNNLKAIDSAAKGMRQAWKDEPGMSAQLESSGAKLAGKDAMDTSKSSQPKSTPSSGAGRDMDR